MLFYRRYKCKFNVLFIEKYTKYILLRIETSRFQTNTWSVLKHKPSLRSLSILLQYWPIKLSLLILYAPTNSWCKQRNLMLGWLRWHNIRLSLTLTAPLSTPSYSVLIDESELLYPILASHKAISEENHLLETNFIL